MLEAQHRDGLWWHEAPRPRRLHRCTPWTTGTFKTCRIDRCACGATRVDGGGWIDRNSRKRQARPDVWAWEVLDRQVSHNRRILWALDGLIGAACLVVGCWDAVVGGSLLGGLLAWAGTLLIVSMTVVRPQVETR